MLDAVQVGTVLKHGEERIAVHAIRQCPDSGAVCVQIYYEYPIQTAPEDEWYPVTYLAGLGWRAV